MATTSAMSIPSSRSLRILCLDGGGIKGYTALLVLKRIFRTLAAEENLEEEPKPCDVFQLIAGTSTGGLVELRIDLLMENRYIEG
jgi:patatin-like phospholipase/acyl hydrolase